MAPRLGSLGRGGHGPRTALPDRALLSGCASAARRRAHPPLLGGASAARRSRLGRVLRCVLGCSPALARSRCAHPRPLLGWLHTRLPLGCASAAPALRPPCSSWLLCALAAPAFLWPVCSSAAAWSAPRLSFLLGRSSARPPGLGRLPAAPHWPLRACCLALWWSRWAALCVTGVCACVCGVAAIAACCGAGAIDALGGLVVGTVGLRRSIGSSALRLRGFSAPSLSPLYGVAPPIYPLPRSRDPSALAVRRAASVFCRLLAVRQAF